MVESKRRSSLLGALALLGGIAAAVLIKFNPTGVSSVAMGPITLSLPVTVGAASLLVALIAFLAAASSPRTGTGLPILAVLICGGASLVAYKPDLLARFTRPAAPPPAQPAPAAVQAPAVATPAPQDDVPVNRPKTIFDSDYPASTPDSQTKKDTPAPQVNVPETPAPTPAPPHVDNAAAIADARSRLEAARKTVQASLASTPDYQAAKSEADAADADLKQARAKNDPGSPELITASQTAMNAHAKVQKLIADALAKDPAAQQATHDLQTAQSTTH